MKKILLFILLFLSINGFAQDSENVDLTKDTTANTIQVKPENLSSVKIENASKATGDSAYIKEDYTTAIAVYESLLPKGEAAEIYYNLGNSYYKKNEIAKAILNYERALLLEPGNSDIRANLEIARSKTVDKVEVVPDVFFISWIKSLTNSLSIDSWAMVGIISFILFIIALYFFIFSKQVLRKKIGFVCAIIFLVITIGANLFAFRQKKQLENRSEAIVMKPSITVRSTPSADGTSLFILHEGHKVGIKDNSMKDWKEIRLEDDKVGWVQTSDLEII